MDYSNTASRRTNPAHHTDLESKPELVPQSSEPTGRKRTGDLRPRESHKRSLPQKPLITVITVVFNAASTIEDTIQSVINQSYDNVEYIVIDGGSTDGTQDIIRKYEYAIDYWISEPDGGIYDAMNKGISLASGMYIGLLNSDDFFVHSGVLQDIVGAINTHNVDLVFSSLDIVDRVNTRRVLRCYRVAHFSHFYLRIGIMPPHPTFYCKRSVYVKVGEYRTDYRVAADFEMTVRLFVKERISWHFLDEVTIHMRAGGISNDGLSGQVQQNIEIVRACRENGFYTNILLVALKLPWKLLQFITAKVKNAA